LDNVVKSVDSGSIAEEIGIEPGDILVSVNNTRLKDILDYRFFTASDEYVIEILKKNGETEIIEIYNEDYEDLGIHFENFLMDKEQWCHNKCVFCFVDQLPKNMRKSLYYKDDDYRLSALMGNYITLTNLKEADIDRIINMHLPRINISVHAVDKELRSKLLNHKNADVMPIIKRFAEAGIYMDCQVVLCKGLNDGQHLDETITELAKYYPYVQCLCVVPVGLTEHRSNLCKLERFDATSSLEVINQIEGYNDGFKAKLGTNFVFASDEFYVIADHRLPEFDYYEDFLQLENGVGLLTSLISEFNEAPPCEVVTKKTIATGVSAAPYIEKLVNSVTDKVQVIPIKNDFLGHTITVAGLTTGHDIINQLKGKELGEMLLIPDVMLNYDGLFLDDLNISDIENALDIKVKPVPNDGAALRECIGG